MAAPTDGAQPECLLPPRQPPRRNHPGENKPAAFQSRSRNDRQVAQRDIVQISSNCRILKCKWVKYKTLSLIGIFFIYINRPIRLQQNRTKDRINFRTEKIESKVKNRDDIRSNDAEYFYYSIEELDK